jgi:hypothetical protein
MEIDPARKPPAGASGWACPHCLAPLVAAESRDAMPLPRSSPLPAEAEGWIRRELEALEARIKADLRQGTTSPGVAAPRPAGQAPSRPTSTRDRAALVCEEDAALAAQVANVLTEMGLVPEIANELKAALRRIAQAEPALLVVSQSLASDAQAGAKILDFVNKLPGLRRRQMFVACLSSDVRTMDTGSAFILGANLTINRQDVGRLAEALQHGLAERDELYRLFTEVSEAVQG